ncbi:heme-binding domain-containing protein [Chitinophaga qingshengii]|uniref:Heme-binding domain-containing protein n=1 Tax=Chitinophaga qingshengii TaxID=1569794 RepID=A0ABR7TIJ5_9BACT|nr:heme-binding domain-containing protein [Chitinophaga qingshengii]MBC9929219.1 heme-binding domain-containing protein [Chitinophaga qingshengii]
MKRKRIYIVPAALVAVLLVLQLFTQPIASKPVTGHMEGVPEEVLAILQRSCYNCHSNEQHLSWFDKLAPAAWAVKKDVERAREVMNFSEWNKLSPADHTGKMYAILNMLQAGKMPLPEYLLLHPEAKISDRDIAVVKKYTLSLSGEDTGHHDAQPVTGGPRPTAPVSPNGVQYTDAFKQWPVISMSTLFDHSIRVIYGNDIAVKAVREENFFPWPDGAIVVKAVWKQETQPNGEIRPGEFVNAQFMEKDAQKYKTTEGWGFAKFSGPQLKPTGKDALFAQQSCIGCHRQLSAATGYLFDVPMKVNPPSLTDKILSR